MILDSRTQFASAVALNLGAAGSYLIGDVVDTLKARDLGWGDEEVPWFVCQVQTTATSGGAATLNIQLISDSAASMAVAPVIHFDTGPIVLASLIVGFNICAVRLPAEGIPYKQFLGIRQVTGVAAFTAGKINSFLTMDFSKVKLYADAVN
jgi:hypothetical protein